MYHGNLTILLHPNSGHPKIDHLLNGFWIKSILPLDGKDEFYIINSIFILLVFFFFRRSIE
jgi:aromatic ring-cleaving dioxygenase